MVGIPLALHHVPLSWIDCLHNWHDIMGELLFSLSEWARLNWCLPFPTYYHIKTIKQWLNAEIYDFNLNNSKR
jgi:hypothetical protein